MLSHVARGEMDKFEVSQRGLERFFGEGIGVKLPSSPELLARH